MLQCITPDSTIQDHYLDYLHSLRKTSFNGQIRIDYASRLAVATDNSIYQVIPQAVIFPRNTQDVIQVLKLAAKDPYHSIQFCPRGGGTSTNGQSISQGIILDCSKWMREILEINTAEGWVRVQPGVVLDQLNLYLKPHGVCFAPEISPSNRATIGGMINTDACGIGSRILGRTSDHVLELTCVSAKGEIIDQKKYFSQIMPLLKPHQATIDEKFSSAPRTLNGYNLKKILTHQNLNYLFCGSEGTLGVVSECKLKLTPLPKFKKMIVVQYRHFDDALRFNLIEEPWSPLVIEAIDEKLIELARQDSLYFQIKDFIENTTEKTGAVNLLEFVADSELELEDKIKHFKNNLHNALGYYEAKNEREEKLLWDLRKKSVGLISKKLTGTRRHIPFIEDTAVPPEKLADYIGEFKKILDSYHLTYGMYGHVDAGCVHVRPALDMQKNDDERLMLELSEKIVSLLEKYGGILWGEHGQGRRSVFAERFFGETLYAIVRQIKTLFDPHNQLNPGKIAVPFETTGQLLPLQAFLRGEFDRQIESQVQSDFPKVMACNGNGACFNYSTADVMCPSYKVTGDRIQSPKGRATVMKEWLRLSGEMLSNSNKNMLSWFKRIYFSWKNAPDFSHEVYSAMSGCLSCKACANQCPLNVDVPEFKSIFLSYYHQRYLRSLRDYFIASMEKMAVIQAKLPSFFQSIIRFGGVKYLLCKWIKLDDIPSVSSVSIAKELKKRRAPLFQLEKLKILTKKERKQSVILIQDVFTSFYEPSILLATYDFLTKIGFTVYVAPFFENGKALHVKGFLNAFDQIVKKNNIQLEAWGQLDIAIIGIDPSMTLTFRDEYAKLIPNKKFHVFLLQEFLIQYLNLFQTKTLENYFLLSHCTEKTMCAESEKQWKNIFLASGFNLIPLAAGCCGMAGSYGHEVEHKELSLKLFNMDWESHLKAQAEKILATGYSCRSQTSRIKGLKLKHPIQILNEKM